MRDDLGIEVAVPAACRRVVSLVPSLTEALAATAPDLLVGATDWCTHPAELDVSRVRGTKNPDLASVRALEPDLVLANDEENRPADLAALRESGVPVWTTAPRTVDAALTSLEAMLAACRLTRPAWLAEAEGVWSAVRAPTSRRRALIPVWRRPWMALGRDTFAGDLLARLGVDNVLAEHREPAGSAYSERYPRIELDDVPDHDLVVLPDEPYAFGPDDGPEAFPDVAARCVSGRHLTWYGPSLVEAPVVLAEALR